MDNLFDNLNNLYMYLKYIFCKYCYTTKDEVREQLIL